VREGEWGAGRQLCPETPTGEEEDAKNQAIGRRREMKKMMSDSADLRIV